MNTPRDTHAGRHMARHMARHRDTRGRVRAVRKPEGSLARKAQVAGLTLALVVSLAPTGIARAADNTEQLEYNPQDATIETNSGSIYLNEGEVTTNTGTVSQNDGTVGTNAEGGSVAVNYATVGTNEGELGANFGGTVGKNSGTIDINLAGDVESNTGTVTDNSGDVGTNAEGAVVSRNGSGAVVNAYLTTADADKEWVIVSNGDDKPEYWVSEQSYGQGKCYLASYDANGSPSFTQVDLPEDLFQAIASAGTVQVNQGTVTNAAGGATNVRFYDSMGKEITLEGLFGKLVGDYSDMQVGYEENGPTLAEMPGGLVVNNLESGIVHGAGNVTNNFAGTVDDTVAIENDLRKVAFEADDAVTLSERSATENDTYNDLTQTEGTLWYASGGRVTVLARFADGHVLDKVTVTTLDGAAIEGALVACAQGADGVWTVTVSGSRQNMVVSVHAKAVESDTEGDVVPEVVVPVTPEPDSEGDVVPEVVVPASPESDSEGDVVREVVVPVTPASTHAAAATAAPRPTSPRALPATGDTALPVGAFAIAALAALAGGHVLRRREE